MKTFRFNAVMAGLLYFLGSAFGVASTIVGGKVLSVISTEPLMGADLLNQIATDSSNILLGSFLILLMGISLVGMTVFLYPIFRRDSEELAMGMLLFRGALEGAYYIITTIGFLVLVALGTEYVATGSNSTVLESMGNVVFNTLDYLGPIGSILFLIGATFLYVSFYRTKLIPRWLSVWGLIGVAPYLSYAILHLFGMDNGIGFYLQMVLAPQELIMGLWLIIKGFNHNAINKLMTD